MGMRKRGLCSIFLLMTVVLSGWAVSCKREPAPSSATTPAHMPEASKSDPFADRLSQIVAAYRKVIVLLESEEAMSTEERSKAATAGEIIYHDNHQRLMDVGEQFGQELEAMSAAGFSSVPPNLNRFLDYLEQSPDLHDADKLVFREVVEDASSALHEMKADAAVLAALLTRLDDDLKALQEIQSLYDKELERILGRFHKRGMVVRREAWEAYVAYLKTRYSRAQILQEYASAIQNIAASRNGRDSALVTYGKSLPPKTLILTFDDGPQSPSRIA